jgi:hypothetical protein
MFDFLKPKVTIPELADRMFNYTLNTKWQELDNGIIERATNTGYNVEGFSFEYLCLRMFSTVLYVSNNLPPAFRDEFLDKWFVCNRLYTDSLGLKQIVQTTHEGRLKVMHDLMTERLVMYYKLAGDNPKHYVEKVAERFSELCSGNPKDAWLTHIGESTFVLRGSTAWEYLKSLKVLPPEKIPS